MNESGPAKVSSKVKAIIYLAVNFGALFFSWIVIIQGVSARTGLIVYMASVVWLNLMLWVGFKIKDKGTHKSVGKKNPTSEAAPKKISLRFKILCYAGMNIVTFFFCATEAIQNQMSFERTLTIYLASASWINFLFWFLFRNADRSRV